MEIGGEVPEVGGGGEERAAPPSQSAEVPLGALVGKVPPRSPGHTRHVPFPSSPEK